jgi:hypothetical protein
MDRVCVRLSNNLRLGSYQYHKYGGASFVYSDMFSYEITELCKKLCLYSAIGKSLCTYKRCRKWCPRASIQAWTRLILFANTFCRSACEMFLMYAVIAVYNSLSVCGRSRYRSLSAQRLSERTVFNALLKPASGTNIIHSTECCCSKCAGCNNSYTSLLKIVYFVSFFSTFCVVLLYERASVHFLL